MAQTNLASLLFKKINFAELTFTARRVSKGRDFSENSSSEELVVFVKVFLSQYLRFQVSTACSDIILELLLLHAMHGKDVAFIPDPRHQQRPLPRSLAILATIFAIFFAFSVLPLQADAFLQPGDAIRDYVLSAVPRGKKLSAYERELLLALGTMDADVAAQSQPIIRSSSSHDGSGKDKSYSMHPLTFGIPSKHVQDAVQPKGRVLSTVVPGDWSTYAYMPREDQTPQQRAQLERDYYVDMQRSFFGLTWKKGGWDCLRHIELLASGCLPLFTDIARAPRGVLSLYPKRVFQLLLDFPGIMNLTGVPGRQGTPTSTDPSFDPKDRVVVIDQEKINLPLYATAVNVLLEFTRDRLTTEAVAAHVLSRMGVPIVRPRRWFDNGNDEGGSSSRRRRKCRTDSTVAGVAFKTRPGSFASSSAALSVENSDPITTNFLLHPAYHPSTPTKILFLSMEKVDVDYMTDTLLHGFKALLGDANVVDYHRRSILYNTPTTLLEKRWGPKRTAQYGAGFSYAYSMLFALDSSDGDGKVDINHVEDLLRMDVAAQAFDAVIFGLVHRKTPPLMQEVCRSYPRERVAAVHGHDRPPTDAELERYDACAKYQFVREAY